MPSAMVTFNGRITLPPDIRKQLGLKTGDAIEFVEIGEGRFAIRPCSTVHSGSPDLGEEAPVMANAGREAIQ